MCVLDCDRWALLLPLRQAPAAKSDDTLGTPCSFEDQCLGQTPAGPVGTAPRCLAGGSGAFCVTDHNPHNATCRCGVEACNRTRAAPAIMGKKQLLVIGDSISLGWSARAAANLSSSWQLTHAGAGNTFGMAENNGNANWIRHCLGGWIASGSQPATAERWDMIVLNAGLHDLARDNQHLSVASYAALLGQIFGALAERSPRATLALMGRRVI
jgi:hypothetical protein